MIAPEHAEAFCNAWIDCIASVLVHLGTKLAIVAALPAWMHITGRLNRHRAELDSLNRTKPDAGA